MESLPSPLARFRSSLPILGLVLAVSAVLLGAVLFLHYWKGIEIGMLTVDPVIALEGPIYTGFLSQIGIFFWSAAAAVCVFSAKVLSRHPDGLKIKRFLFVSALLTLVLGVDDAFLLHEGYLRRLGVPEIALFVSYAGLMLFYLAGFYSIILETDYIVLGVALAFFGVSIALDLIHPRGTYRFLFEDGAKLVGIVSWLAYSFRISEFAVDRYTVQQSAAPDD